MSANPDDLARLTREELLAITWKASVAYSRYLDYADKPGFPPGECAWAMAHDLAAAFEDVGVPVESFGDGVRNASPLDREHPQEGGGDA